jgi:hypothetical protein
MFIIIIIIIIVLLLAVKYRINLELKHLYKKKALVIFKKIVLFGSYT